MGMRDVYKRDGKYFLHKVFDNGNKFLTTWSEDVTNVPSFTWNINGSMGEMIIELARPIDDFGEVEDVNVSNRIKTFILDDNNKDGVQIYDGEVVRYDPIISEDGTQVIRVHVVSQVKTLEDLLYKSGSDTTVTQASQDPSDIMKDIIDNNAGTINYTATSIDDTGTTVTYTYKYVTSLEAVKKTLELCPAWWYWYVDGTSTLFLRFYDINATDYTLFIGKEISSVDATKTIESLYNAVYFVGGGDPNLYRLYERAGSIDDFGRREKKMSDDRVTDANTAETMSDKFLEENDHPQSEIKVKVLDDSVDNERGFNIELFRPGQAIKVNHPQIEPKESLWDQAIWDVDFWDINNLSILNEKFEIRQIQYNFDHAILTLVSKVEEVSKRIEDINRNLEVKQTENIPLIPT